MLMASNSKHRQLGINLIELMIGIAVSLVILTGVLSMMLRTSVSSGEIVQSSRLNQQMRGALDLMGNELQRAGYVNWFEAWDQNDDGVLDNINGDTDDAGNPRIDILDYYEAVNPVLNEMGRIDVSNNCILYSYDLDGDGGKSTGQFESFGFRLANGAIQMRTAGNGHACDTGTWQAITDSTVTITNLTFGLAYVNDATTGDSTLYSYTVGPSNQNWPDTPLANCDPLVTGALPEDGDVLCLGRRTVDITVEGQLASDANVTLSLTTRAKVRNDHFNTSNPAP